MVEVVLCRDRYFFFLLRGLQWIEVSWASCALSVAVSFLCYTPLPFDVLVKSDVDIIS